METYGVILWKAIVPHPPYQSRLETIESGLSALKSSAANKIYLDYANHTYIPANADLNDYLTVGRYTCSSNANAATLINSPVTVAGSLYVVNSLGGEKTLTGAGY